MMYREAVSSARLRRFLPVALLAVAAAACGRSAPADRVGVAGEAVPPVASAASRAHLYVSDETGGQVVVVDAEAGEVVERIAVGKRPRGIALAPDGRRLYVALSGSPIAGPGVDESTLPPPDRAADGIGVVDRDAKALVRTYPSGQDPEAFAVSADGTRIYVSNEDAAQMSVLDLVQGEVVGRVAVGEEPEIVALRPDGRVVYVGCEGTNEVVAVDTASLKVVARIRTGARPRGIAFTSDGLTAFTADENNESLTVIDATRHAPVGTIRIPRTEGTPTVPRPMWLVLSPDGRSLYASLGRARSVAVIDVQARQFVRSIEDVGARPWGMAISEDGRTLYTANGPSGDVAVVDIASGTVERRITTGGSPWGVVVATTAGARD